jgi:hypothetical protein
MGSHVETGVRIDSHSERTQSNHRKRGLCAARALAAFFVRKQCMVRQPGPGAGQWELQVPARNGAAQRPCIARGSARPPRCCPGWGHRRQGPCSWRAACSGRRTWAATRSSYAARRDYGCIKGAFARHSRLRCGRGCLWTSQRRPKAGNILGVLLGATCFRNRYFCFSHEFERHNVALIHEAAMYRPPRVRTAGAPATSTNSKSSAQGAGDDGATTPSAGSKSTKRKSQKTCARNDRSFGMKGRA